MTDFSKTLVRASMVYGIMAGEGNNKTPYEKWQDAVNYVPILEAKYANFRNKECKTALETLDKIELAKANAIELEKRKDDDMPLSEGAKTFLAKLYAAVKYGKWSTFKDRGNKYTVKGQMAEEEAITMLSRLDKRMYVKNDQRIHNEYVSGVPDVIIATSYEKADYVIDVKCPYDIETFISNLGKPLNSQYEYQLQTYLWLTGADRGDVSYCLMNTPEYILNTERRRLFDRMEVLTEEDERYKEAVKTLENNLTFDDMPLKDRRMKFVVERDDELHRKIAKRVLTCREYLMEIEKLHLDAIEFAEFKENLVKLEQCSTLE